LSRSFGTKGGSYLFHGKKKNEKKRHRSGARSRSDSVPVGSNRRVGKGTVTGMHRRRKGGKGEEAQSNYRQRHQWKVGEEGFRLRGFAQSGAAKITCIRREEKKKKNKLPEKPPIAASNWKTDPPLTKISPGLQGKG